MNSYLKLGLKTLVFILCLIIMDWFGGGFLELIQEKSKNKWPYSLDSKTSYMVDKVNTEIVIVGSSTASHHYIPKMITDSTGLTTYNCAIDGHCFLYQNELINLMLDRYRPKIIIWEIGEHFLSIKKDKEYQSISDIYPYYGNKHTKELVDGKDIFQKYRMLSKLFRYNSTISSVVYNLIKKDNSRFEFGYVPIDTCGYVFPTKEMIVFDDPIDSSKIDVFKQTVKRCRDNDILLIIPSSPRFCSTKTLDAPDYQCFLSLIGELHVPYVNNFSLYENDSTLFRDASHMNDLGTRKYMEVFIPQLKEVINNEKYND